MSVEDQVDSLRPHLSCNVRNASVVTLERMISLGRLAYGYQAGPSYYNAGFVFSYRIGGFKHSKVFILAKRNPVRANYTLYQNVVDAKECIR